MGIIMALVALSVLTGTSCYISNRLYKGLAVFFPSLKFWPVLVVVCAVTLLLVLGFGRALLPLPTGVKQMLGLISAYLMGAFIYLLLFTVVSDIIFAIPRLMKLSFILQPRFNGIVTVLVLALTIGTCVYGAINARCIDHVSYSIALHNKKDISDIKLVMISDLHLGAVGSESRLEKTVREINSTHPDIVCIAGDFFDTDYSAISDPEAALETIKKIDATYGVYACLGNHDGGETYAQMTEFLEKAGIRLLNDTYTVIDDRLVLAGRLDASPIGGYGEEKRKPLSEILSNTDPDLPVIVLDHNPANIDEYGAETDLVLSGHTHKGQIFPANIVTDLLYEVDYGYYRKDENSPHTVVSSGVGYWGMPLRVGTNCEIVSVIFSDN